MISKSKSKPERYRIWALKNRDWKLAYMRKWTAANRVKVRGYKKSYYLRNKSKIAAYKNRWKEKNRAKCACYTKKWLRLNPNYKKNLRATNPNYAIRERLSNRIRTTLTRKNLHKSVALMDLLGITIPEFRNYLESKFLSGMTWGNMRLWHVDHIKPCARFDLTKRAEQLKCFHYSNQQPLWATDNLKKHDK